MTSRIPHKKRALDQEQISKNVARAVEGLIADGTALRETLYIINSVALKAKGLWIIQHDGICQVRRFDFSKGEKLFSHVSLAACVEFALKYEAPHD